MNRSTIIGRLVRDPELRFVASTGLAICRVTVAVDREMSKEKKEEARAQGKPTADYIPCTAYGKRAETIANYFSKGKPIIIEGRFTSSTYKTNEGETRYSNSITIEKFEFVPSGGGAGSGGGSESSNDFNFGDYNPDDFQAIEDDENIPF
jgi:single-strand DNA-binding protein